MLIKVIFIIMGAIFVMFGAVYGFVQYRLNAPVNDVPKKKLILTPFYTLVNSRATNFKMSKFRRDLTRLKL